MPSIQPGGGSRFVVSLCRRRRGSAVQPCHPPIRVQSAPALRTTGDGRRGPSVPAADGAGARRRVGGAGGARPSVTACARGGRATVVGVRRRGGLRAVHGALERQACAAPPRRRRAERTAGRRSTSAAAPGNLAAAGRRALARVPGRSGSTRRRPFVVAARERLAGTRSECASRWAMPMELPLADGSVDAALAPSC